MVWDKKRAYESIQKALTLTDKSPEVLFDAAFVHNHLGDTSQALTWLQKAITAGYSISQVKDNPDFDRLRDNPAFQALTSGK
jgi:hypothetical protein